VASIALLIFILFGASYIEMIPIAALVGVMFMVVIGTFAWNTFNVMNKIPISDAIVILVVTVVTVMFDLAVAVISGVIVSALVFAWENAIRIRVRKHIDKNGVKHYEIFGPLFFGSTQLFTSKFNIKEDPEEVIIDFAESRVADHSGIEAINKLAQKYTAAGKKLHLRHLSPDCRKLIDKADKIIDVNIMEDPEYIVAVDGFEDYTVQ
jgi:SulP family sulfate permease